MPNADELLSYFGVRSSKGVVHITWFLCSMVFHITHEHTHTGVCVITTGFQARSRGGRWSWTIKLAQKRLWAGRWSWAVKVGLLSLRVVPQQQCNGHCPCDSAQHDSCNSNCVVPGQWRGDTALTLPLFWRRSTVSPVFFGRYPWSSLHSVVLFPPIPVPNKPPRFCGCKAIWSRSYGVSVRRTILGSVLHSLCDTKRQRW